MANEALDIRIGVDISTPDVSLAVDRRWKNVEFEVSRGSPAYLPYEGPYEEDASFYYDKILPTFAKYNICWNTITICKYFCFICIKINCTTS